MIHPSDGQMEGRAIAYSVLKITQTGALKFTWSSWNRTLLVTDDPIEHVPFTALYSIGIHRMQTCMDIACINRCVPIYGPVNLLVWGINSRGRDSSEVGYW